MSPHSSFWNAFCESRIPPRANGGSKDALPITGHSSLPFAPSLIVHGGAWTIPGEAVEDCLGGCRSALQAGWVVLRKKGSALDAVEAAIVVLEDDPVFDAGFGSHLNRDGRVQLDAILMDGASLDSGAVAAVERIRNPIRLARRVMEASPHSLLVGPGALQFATTIGFPLCDPAELIHPREHALWRSAVAGLPTSSPPRRIAGSDSRGTVGAVALDARGGLAAGTSTGGTCCKLPGRVGDSPLVGCGCYADAESGGASATGSGEAIMKIVMAKSATDFMRRGSTAQQAADACIHLLHTRAGATGGVILLDRFGRPAAAFNTPHMAHGYVAQDGSFVVAV